MASEDILLEARGDASNLESEFEGAQVVVERAMDGAQRAIESVDPSALEDAGAGLGDALADGAERAGDALRELTSDLDGAASSAQEASTAAAETADAQRQVEETAAGASSAVHDLASAEDDLATAQRAVADSSSEATEQTQRTADAADLLSTATRNAAEAGSEAGQRIRDAMEAIARSTGDVTEGVHSAEQAFEALGGSPSEFIGATNSDLEKQVVLLADLQKNVRQLDEESREGLGGFADRAAKVSQRMAELDRLVEKQGDQTLPQVRQELERLRQQYRQTFDEGARRAANLEVEIEGQENALKRLKLEAQGSAGELVDLTEALRLRFPAAAKGIASAVSALAAFQAAFQGTRSFIEFLERDFGIGVDAFITRVAGLEDTADAMVGSASSVRESMERISNQLKVLEGTGVDVDELRRKHAELQQQLQDDTAALTASKGLDDFSAALRQSRDTTAEVEALVKKADAAWSKYSATQRKVGTDASAAASALEALEERALGVKVPDLVAQYTELADAFRVLKDRGDEFRDTPVLAQFAEEVSEVRESLEALPPELAKLFERATGTSAADAVAQIDAMANSLDLVGIQSEEAKEKAKKAAEETAKAWADAATSTADAWSKVEQQLLSLNDVAEDATPTSDSSGLLQGLDAARQRLAKLEEELAGLRGQDFLDLGEVNRESDLIGQIGRVRQEVSQLEREAAAVRLDLDAGPALTSAAAAGRDLGATLKEALRSSGFVDAFRELAPQVQQEVAVMVSELDRLASSGETLDPQLVVSYGQAIRQALGGEAVGAVQGLGGALGDLPGQGGSAVETLLAIARASREGAGGAGELSSQVADLSSVAGEGTITLSKTGETIARIGEMARAAAGDVASLEGDATAAASGVGDLGSAAESTGAAAEGARIKIEGAGDSVRVIRTEAEGVAASVPAAAEALGQLGTSASEATPPVQTLATAAQEASGHLTATADAAERLAAAEDVGPRVEEIAAAAATASPAVGELADHTVRLADSLTTALQQGEDLPSVFEALVGAVESLDPVLATHLETIEAVGEGYLATAEGAERITEVQGPLNVALTETNDSLTVTEQQLVALDPQLATFEDRLASVEERLQGLTGRSTEAGEKLEALVSTETLGRLGELVNLLANATTEAGRLADELERADRAAQAVTS